MAWCWSIFISLSLYAYIYRYVVEGRGIEDEVEGGDNETKCSIFVLFL